MLSTDFCNLKIKKIKFKTARKHSKLSTESNTSNIVDKAHAARALHHQFTWTLFTLQTPVFEKGDPKEIRVSSAAIISSQDAEHPSSNLHSILFNGSMLFGRVGSVRNRRGHCGHEQIPGLVQLGVSEGLLFQFLGQLGL